MPTIQSASERDRAAASSGSISSPSRSRSNASCIAARVIDESHSRLTGFLTFAVSYTYAKISSPSRPASHAFTTLSMSSERRKRWMTESCFFDLSSFGTSLNFLGTIGRSA